MISELSKIEREPKPMEVGFVSLSAKYREEKGEENEDAALGEEGDIEAREKLVFGVFDGIGGHQAGERASRLAKEEIWKNLKEVKPEAKEEEWIKAFEDAFLRANGKIFAEGILKLERRGMGTTATAAKIIKKPEGGAELVYGHVGNSRLYVLRADGNLERVTEDDKILKTFLEEGNITKEQAQKFDQRTSKKEIEEVFKTDKEKNVLKILSRTQETVEKSLGLPKEKFQVAVGKVNLKSGDRVIITSDGIHDNLTNEQIKNLLSASPDDQEAAEKIANGARLISESGKFRSKDDDMTILVKTIK